MASRHDAAADPAPRRRAPHNKQTVIKVTKTIPRPREAEKHTPSAYLAQMRMNTGERLSTVTEMYPPTITELLDIAASSHQKDFCVSMDQALFQPFPSEVVFQQFQPQQTFEFPLNFRNNDRVARHLKVTHEDSPYFRAVCQRPAGSKVAPGMEVTYLILFTPDEKKDYHLELVCITEREKFVVPVRAVGVRALLDFPDDIHFPASPVKYPSGKTILVRNVGDKEAQFTLETKSPYSVAPTSASLEVGHCMQVTVTFCPTTVGDFSAELTVHYDTGESVYSLLHGSSVDVNVRLDRSSLKLENTYIKLSTQRSVVLHNRSKVVVHYQWKAFSSVEEEEAQKLLNLTQLEEEEAMAQEVLLERSLIDPTMRDRLPIVAHSLAHKKKVKKFILYSIHR
jgi:hydrocephalus-inducing protein